MVKRTSILTASLLLGFCASAVNAAQWDIRVTNLTHGNHFTPLYLRAHAHGEHLFEAGSMASSSIQSMAECGDIAPLMNESATDIEYVGSALTNPGATTPAVDQAAISLVTDSDHLSIVAMVLPTNDAFIGLDSQHIPAEPGTYTYYLNAYDAGTEANDERLDPVGDGCVVGNGQYIPAAPGMDVDSGGTGVEATQTAQKNITIHRGVLGDAEVTGDGKSDLVSSIHRWQNPVAKVTVTVTR